MPWAGLKCVIVFLPDNTYFFKSIKRRYYGVKGLVSEASIYKYLMQLVIFMSSMSRCHSNAFFMRTSSVFEVCNQVRFKTSRSANKTDHKIEKLDVACIVLFRQ